MTKTLQILCAEKKIIMTDQRSVIVDVIASSTDHPDVEELHKRCAEIDPKISIATVYRTVKLLEENQIIQKHDFFGDGRARYEAAGSEHHDHMINITTGEVVEFFDQELEKLQDKIADKYGFKIVDHRMELYVVPKENE